MSLKAVDQPRFGECFVHVRSLLVEVQIFVGDFAGGVRVPRAACISLRVTSDQVTRCDRLARLSVPMLLVQMVVR